MATLPLKVFKYPVMSSIPLFVFGEKNDRAQMPFSLRCVQCMVTSVLWDQQYTFGVKTLLMVTKVLDLVAVLFRRPMQRSQQSILSCGVTGIWWDKSLNKFGQKNEALMFDVQTRLLTELVLFPGNSHCVQHLRVVRENCCAKYCTDWLSSKY